MKTLILLQIKLAITCLIVAMLWTLGCTTDTELNPELNPMNESLTKSELGNTLTESSDSLSDNEISSLMFMVEEEKLARDVYFKMLDLYGLKIFDNISQSEVKHMNAVSLLIDKYGLVNPTTDNPPGVFVNEELQLFYNDLIEMGSISKKEAINVGVIIEEKDIVDIQEYLDFVIISTDIEQVYNNLLSGSVKHLAAFSKRIE